jgi:hypothetical protein
MLTRVAGAHQEHFPNEHFPNETSARLRAGLNHLKRGASTSKTTGNHISGRLRRRELR